MRRRDLTVYERSILALKLKPVIAAKAKENQIRKPAEFVPKNSWEQTEQPTPTEKRKENRQNETLYQVAKAARVSEDTIAKVEKIQQHAKPEIKAALLVESEIAQKAKENSLANLKRNTESDICPTRTTTADLPKEDILPKQDWRAKRETSTNNQLAQMRHDARNCAFRF